MIKKVKKVWGSEEWIVNNEKYCGKILNLNKGYRSSLHFHKKKHETFYILDGKIILELENISKLMKAGEVHNISPGEKHRFTPLENSKLIEFSTHHEDSDTYRETESGKIDL